MIRLPETERSTHRRASSPRFLTVILVIAWCVRVVTVIARLAGYVDLPQTWAVWVAGVDAALLVGLWLAWWGDDRWVLGWLTFLAGGICLASVSWAMQWPGLRATFVGACFLGIGLAVGVWLLRLILSAGHPVLAVARALVEEAVRMRVVLGLILCVVLFGPLLPALFDPSEKLSYRVQMFLTWSLSGSVVMLSLMTLLVACGSISGDLSQRHIYVTMSKPVSRRAYVCGKWLGLALLNLIMVTTLGSGVYAFVKVLEQEAGGDASDRAAVESQVLVARRVVGASPPGGMDVSRLTEETIDALRVENAQQDVGRVEPSMRRAIQQGILARWHTVDPLDSKQYRFIGLDQAKPLGNSVQLRLKPDLSRIPPDGLARLYLTINNRPYGSIAVAEGIYHVVDVPLSAVADSGRLELKITNVNASNPRATFPASVSFTPGEGLQVLYQVDSFGPNLLRALTVIWVRLSFLAMLGIASAALLSFPVACLLSGLVFFAATASGFLVETMQMYVTFHSEAGPWWQTAVRGWDRFVQTVGEGQWWDAVRIPVSLIGSAFVAAVPSFAEHNPVPLVADGRMVGWPLVGSTLWRIGLVWTGACGAVGWLIFKHRELASASG